MIAKGARPQTSPLPLTREVDMANPFSFAAFPAWKRVFADTSKAAQKAVYADPAFRNQFREDLKNPTGFGNWGRIGVYNVRNPALKSLEGKSIAQIGQEQGKDGVDAFLDTVLADNLEVELTMASWNTREDRMRELLNNRAILMALGDGGAHVDMLCDAGYPTYLLGTWVRDKQAITLEEGVRKLTSDPADLFGLKDRGRLAKGVPADVAIFDPSAIGSNNHGERRYDLPGGAKRIVMPSRGVEYTVVNGAITWEQGKLNEAKAGKVLRG
jgi:N-acyl-D-aspartate/D-glutamate deacylase